MNAGKIYKFPKDGVKVKLTTEISRQEYFLEVYEINDKTNGRKCVTYRASKRQGYIGNSYTVGEAERNKPFVGAVIQGGLNAAVRHAARQATGKLKKKEYSPAPKDSIGFINI